MLALDRPRLLARGVTLAWFSVGWNLFEGLVALGAGLAAGSVALLAFGIDSFVESASALIILWRLTAERRATDAERIERIERRAERLIAVSLAALAVYVAWDAIVTIASGERPQPSALGLALAAVAIGVMIWLARAKRQVGAALGSRAMLADAVQTSACWWLSAGVLAGVGLNAAFGWSWADPAAALGIAALVLREAREAWEGEAD